MLYEVERGSWKISNIELSYVVKMVNKELLENVNDGKKYLEEVMGIVEDEEFNKQRRRRRTGSG